MRHHRGDLPAGPFRSVDGPGLGLTRRQLQNRRVLTLAKDVHVAAATELDLQTRCDAIILVLPRGTAFSHYTAAQLYGVPVPDEYLLHVSTNSRIEPRITGVVSHRVHDLGAVQRFRGLPVLSPARTYLDLAARLDLPGLVAAGDALARLCEGGVQDLAHEVTEGARRRGVRLARQALGLLDPRARSGMESRLRLLLVTAGLGAPDVAVEITNRDGRVVATVDLAYARFRIVLEYEGDQHRTDRDQWNRDIHRYERLNEFGWIVIRITAEDIYRYPERIVARVRSAMARNRA
jgi:hypothetical protein